MIRNIIFDMGGVLVDVHRERAVRHFKAIGVSDAEALIDHYHHKGLFFDFENGHMDTADFCRLLGRHAGKVIPQEAIEKAWRSIIDPPPIYKLDFLLKLRQTRKLFLLTNNNPIIFSWACMPDFTQTGRVFPDYFDKAYVSFQMKCMKPNVKIYHMLIEDSGINPAETLFIDDSDLNIQTAREFGFFVLHVENGSDWRHEINIMINH